MICKLDHRKAVAAQRRQRMHQRLVEAAILVVAARGPNETAIDHVVREAGVSRGTFYKYFTGVEDLLLEAKLRLGAELLELVLACETPVEDPAEALAQSMLRFFATFARYPLIGEFAARTGLNPLNDDTSTMKVLHQTVPPMLAAGIEAGRFVDMPVPVAFDFLRSGVVMSFRRRLAGMPSDGAETTAAVLRLLGVPAAEALAFSRMQVAPLEAPEDSLIHRAEMIRAERRAAPR
ncbi:TetR/AcrR family transcriptional regulator [Pseudooceanicola sp. HF7]|uniref:TetR/AcrR family transcriptional regulator n=1 Tax=Pseudooceanicola sp. HF7 TaxID=2721560 RepID=UPI0014319838|nr:TetR/AcrR family transcriptional regulator [Pseudooceanicola sp. HF7]NIZ08439.1 TetR/AcrR family transcriptional regulator [Pseudooceanicola sp. HF7]